MSRAAVFALLWASSQAVADQPVIYLQATFCLADTCKTVPITNSREDESVTPMTCVTSQAQQLIIEYMKNEPQYEGWDFKYRCIMPNGERKNA